jgi:hypothetical protein
MVQMIVDPMKMILKHVSVSYCMICGWAEDSRKPPYRKCFNKNATMETMIERSCFRERAKEVKE